MTLRYLTVDDFDRIYEVTNLFNRLAEPTDDPMLATSCIIKLDEDKWLPEDAANVPIYTVH